MKKQKNKKKDLAQSFHIALILILLILIFVFSLRALGHYKILKSHREYFRQPNTDIQPWMTIRSISKHYNISQDEIFRELNATALNNRLTIESLCKGNHLNCNDVMHNLNALKHND